MSSFDDRSTLGTSGVAVTQLAIGTQPLGGRFEAVNDEQAQATLERAWELGLNYFDTAPLYGRGLAECRLGRFLADRRDGVVVSTKVGRLLQEDPSPQANVETEAVLYEEGPDLVPIWDFSYEGAVLSLNSSLERLGVDSADIVFLHDVSVDTMAEALEGAYRALREYQDEGRIRAIGVGTDDITALAELARSGDFDCFLLPDRYTLLDQTGLSLLDLCATQGVSVIAASVFQGGILADPERWRPYFDEADIDQALSIERVCARHKVPLAAAAMQFPLGHPSVRSVLVGVRSVEEIDRNIELLSSPIPSQLWDELSDGGIVTPNAPLPGRTRSNGGRN